METHASGCNVEMCTCWRLLLLLLLLLLWLLLPLLLVVQRPRPGRWYGLRCAEVLRLQCRQRAVRRRKPTGGRCALEGCVISWGGLPKPSND